ncbi:MAG: hypothetical protein QOE66_369, partial [Chloroflexota bacterium]|nr:hypothetical protein [Chloroflexota bacterium]
MDDTHRQRVARHLFHKSSDALFLFDLGGHRVLDANPAARRLTGFDAAALRAMTLEALFAAGVPDDLAGLVGADRGQAVAYPFRAPRHGFRLRRRRGKPIPVSVGAGVIASGAEAAPLGLAVVRGDDADPREAEGRGRYFALGPDL